MASNVTVLSPRGTLRTHKAAGNSGGYVEEWGMVQFVSTATSGTIPTGLRTITGASFLAVGTPATTAQLFINQTATQDVIQPVAGALTLARVGTATSGQKYFIRLRGTAL